MTRQTNSPPSPPPTSQPLWAFGVRMFWVMVGPGFLALLLLLMGMQKKVWFAGIDGAFLGTLCLLILARWIDFCYADPTLTTGEVATVPQIRNYSIGVVVFGLVSWLTATLLGIYVL